MAVHADLDDPHATLAARPLPYLQIHGQMLVGPYELAVLDPWSEGVGHLTFLNGVITDFVVSGPARILGTRGHVFAARDCAAKASPMTFRMEA
jgi:hypothetical protein